MHINGSIPFVSGANRGLGRALVESLLQRGAGKVYAAARRVETLDALRDPRIVPVRLDITDPDQVASAAESAADTTLLVNNGGSLAFADALFGEIEAFESDMRTNYLGTLAMARAFAPVLEHNGGGAIANVLSLVVFGSVPPMGGYSASKAAAASITQALRAQLAGKGITVHGVFPGAVDTDMIRDFPIAKADASHVAAAILDGIEAGRNDIFPDPMSQAGYEAWRADHAAFERQMASI